MERIRRGIRDQRAGDDAERQARELAEVTLERCLEPLRTGAHLVEHNRRLTPPGRFDRDGQGRSLAPEPFEFDENTVYVSSSGGTMGKLIYLIRKLLNPFLRLFFNPDPIILAMVRQAEINCRLLDLLDRVNAELERTGKKFAAREELDALNYEVTSNLVTEMTRLAVDMKNHRMLVESVAGRLGFEERRAQALESTRQARSTPQAGEAEGAESDGTAAAPTGAGGADGGRGDARARARRARRTRPPARRRRAAPLRATPRRRRLGRYSGRAGAEAPDGAAATDRASTAAEASAGPAGSPSSSAARLPRLPTRRRPRKRADPRRRPTTPGIDEARRRRPTLRRGDRRRVEYLCRLIAEQLARRHEVDVLTTCARDDSTWKNAIRRATTAPRRHRPAFANESTRDPASFEEHSDWIHRHEHSADDEAGVAEAAGAVVPRPAGVPGAASPRLRRARLLRLPLRPDGPGAAGGPGAQHPRPRRAGPAGDAPRPLPRGVLAAGRHRLHTAVERGFLKRRFSIGARVEETVGCGVDLPPSRLHEKPPSEPSASPLSARGAVFRRRHRLYGRLPFTTDGSRPVRDARSCSTTSAAMPSPTATRRWC